MTEIELVAIEEDGLVETPNDAEVLETPTLDVVAELVGLDKIEPREDPTVEDDGVFETPLLKLAATLDDDPDAAADDVVDEVTEAAPTELDGEVVKAELTDEPCVDEDVELETPTLGLDTRLEDEFEIPPELPELENGLEDVASVEEEADVVEIELEDDPLDEFDDTTVAVDSALDELED